jgi:hypothetical protein
MRRVVTGLTLAAVLLPLSGCVFKKMLNPDRPLEPDPTPGALPTTVELVNYLNKRSQEVESIECRNLDVDARARLQSVGMSGYLFCRKPRDFRMTGKVMGSPMVDIGSNGQEFWFWMSKSDPAGLFYCNHAEVAEARLPFPFQPEWVMEALGMGTYTVSDRMKVESTRDTISLVEEALSPQRQPIRKVVVFRRGELRDGQPRVIAHELRTPTGQVICSAKIERMQQDPATGAMVPQAVRLSYPSENMELKLALSDVRLNASLEDRAAGLFTRPRLADVPTYNLAQRWPDGRPNGLRQIRGAGR